MYTISFFGISYACRSSFEAVSHGFYLGLNTYEKLVSVQRYDQEKILKLLDYRETADTINILALRKNRVWKITLYKADKIATFEN